ncbi:hypothetical protein Bbelb_286580 [Branchiostoma belcheri]|nr:hypothetical protein Bbelb_286580 [Branchiostoma belcheri]
MGEGVLRMDQSEARHLSGCAAERTDWRNHTRGSKGPVPGLIKHVGSRPPSRLYNYNIADTEEGKRRRNWRHTGRQIVAVSSPVSAQGRHSRRKIVLSLASIEFAIKVNPDCVGPTFQCT